MSDSKTAKASKSKSNSNNVKTAKLSSQFQFTANGSNSKARSKFETFTKSRSVVPGSILDKLDLEQLKETALKNLKAAKKASLPDTREACIEYALDMVIGNLIQNGHLTRNKAQQIRSPLIISKIATICDEIISAKTEISNAKCSHIQKKPSKSKSTSKKRKRSRPKTKSQKWAIQPAALPITIITNQSLTKLPKFTTLEKMCLGMKDGGSMKSLKEPSTDDLKKQKSGGNTRTRSLDSSSERKKHSSKPQRLLSPRTPIEEKRQMYHQQASSEVPSSSHSLSNLKLLSSTNNDLEPSCTSTRVTEELMPDNKASDSRKQAEDDNKNVIVSANIVITTGGKAEDSKSKDAVRTDVRENKPLSKEPSFDRNRLVTPAPPVTSSPSACMIISNRTLNTLISTNNCSMSPSTGYQMLVDLKGFQNDEISMEVEGRQLIFLASRSKRDELNARKVTEIVDVPQKINMENLKIGRRIDGFVIIEGHDP